MNPPGGNQQGEPERDLHLRPLTYRSFQLGLSGKAVGRYADEWTGPSAT
ncbi:DUF4291 family protein [Streptomyces sp. NPDC005262]